MSSLKIATFTFLMVASCSGSDSSESESVVCEAPKVAHGRLELSHAVYRSGDTARLLCREGYHLDGPDRVRCGRDGLWRRADGHETDILPQCRVRTGCGAPPAASQGYFLELSDAGQVSMPRHDQYEVGARVVYHCNPSHVLVGTNTYQCMMSGEWSPPVAPGCQAERSSAPAPTPECDLPARAPLTEQRLVRGWMSDAGASGGAVVEYACVAGTRDQLEPCRPQQVTCWRGRWMGRRPRCLPVAECAHPPRLVHGEVYGAGRQLGAQVFYSCQPRYRLEGPSSLSCDLGGCWSPRLAPVCMPEPPAPAPLLLSPAAISLLAVTAAVVLLLVVGLLALLLQRRPWKPLRRPPPPPPSVPPRPVDADRVALIAYPEGAQYVLPTYEEAVRSERPLSGGGLGPEQPLGGAGAPFRALHHARSLPPSTRRERLWRRDPESDSVSQRSVQSHQSHHSASTRQSNNTSNATPSLLDSMGSTETMATSDAASTTLSAVANASVRGMCGSLASFDTSSVLNTEGVPLLEENETELETAEEQDAVSCGKLSSGGDSASSK